MHEDLIGLLPEEVTRRSFIVTSLAAGFALAVQPVSAQTITTDAQGLEAGEIKIPVRDGEIPGYRAMPSKGKKFPVVLVVQEIFGVHEHIKDICRRFAKLGYMAIAPALYARQGDVSQLQMEDIMKVVARVPDEQVMSDLDAGVAWYGRLVAAPNAKPNPLTPKQPIELVNELKAPVLGLYGGKDTGIPVETVEQMRGALKKSTSKAARESDLVVYPEAGHGFNADYRPSYNKEAATDGWNRLQAWFKKYGAA